MLALPGGNTQNSALEDSCSRSPYGPLTQLFGSLQQPPTHLLIQLRKSLGISWTAVVDASRMGCEEGTKQTLGILIIRNAGCMDGMAGWSLLCPLASRPCRKPVSRSVKSRTRPLKPSARSCTILKTCPLLHPAKAEASGPPQASRPLQESPETRPAVHCQGPCSLRNGLCPHVLVGPAAYLKSFSASAHNCNPSFIPFLCFSFHGRVVSI